MIPTELMKSIVAWFGEYLKNKPFTDLLLVITLVCMGTLASWMREDFKAAAADRKTETAELEANRLAAQEKAHNMVHNLLKEKREAELADRAQLIELITGLKEQGKKNEKKLDAIPEKTAAKVAEAMPPTKDDSKPE